MKSYYSKLGGDVKPAFVLLIVTALGAAPQLRAQPQPPTSVAFDVASVRPHTGDVVVVGGQFSGPHIRLVALTLTDLIGDAYNCARYQIAGTQGWIESERFDVLANSPGDTAPTKENLRLMLQALLADRFQLKVHLETRKRPVYALVVGKNGPKLKASTAAEYSQTASGNRAALMTFAKATMEQLAGNLYWNAGRPVLDKTGLRGFYDFTLDWTPDYGGPPPPNSSGIDIFTALQEQLGLKLEPQKAPIEMIVVDHAEKPSEN
jgi:uncharacterized protein (TIGR03435 family)